MESSCTTADVNFSKNMCTQNLKGRFPRGTQTFCELRFAKVQQSYLAFAALKNFCCIKNDCWIFPNRNLQNVHVPRENNMNRNAFIASVTKPVYV